LNKIYSTLDVSFSLI